MAQGHWLPQKFIFFIWLFDSHSVSVCQVSNNRWKHNISASWPIYITNNVLLLLHPIRIPYSIITVPSTHTENFTWNHIYRAKPAKISTQSCGTERWRIWGRYYVTNRQNFLLRLTCCSSLLPPTGQFMYYNTKRISLYSILRRIYEAWKSNVKKKPFRLDPFLEPI